VNRQNLKNVFWHGDALDIVRQFPRSVRVNIGSELYLLQLGDSPVHSKPMARVGRGVWEIRVADSKGTFRIFYVVRRKDGIHVLHAFQKKTRKTPKADIELGKSRLQKLQRKM